LNSRAKKTLEIEMFHCGLLLNCFTVSSSDGIATLMSFILVDVADDRHELQINGWNWRPILAFLHSARPITEDQFERMGANGCGGQISANEAKKVAAFLSHPSHARRRRHACGRSDVGGAGPAATYFINRNL